jgi:hypothetical protein
MVNKRIEAEIHALQKRRKELKEVSFFGTHTWACIDAQIEVLKGTAVVDDYETSPDFDLEIFEAMLIAQEYKENTQDINIISLSDQYENDIEEDSNDDLFPDDDRAFEDDDPYKLY